MTVLMERHGKNTRIGNKNIELPDDMSVFAVIGANSSIQDGYVFRPDWLIYRNGKMIKKWFINVENIRVWPPVLEDLKKLEERYHNVQKKWDLLIEKEWKPISDKMLKAKEAHVFPQHVKNNENSDWWLYKTRDDGHTPPTIYISFEWVEKPDHPKNLELGQEYYEKERKLLRYGKYAHMFRTVLNRAIEDFLRENSPKKAHQTLKLDINGRNYWYRSVLGPRNYLSWSKICWAEDEIVELLL